MAASTTPIGAKSCSANVIDIIDSDDEPDVSHNVGESTTSFGAKSSSVINIIDSDDEPDICKNVSLDKKDSGNITLAACFAEEKGKNLDNNPNVWQDMQGSGNISSATCFTEEKGKNLDRNHAGSNEENLDVSEDILFTANTKRKRRACNVVMSESESDRDDDNLPISRFVNNHVNEISVDELVNIVDDDADDGEYDDDMPISLGIMMNKPCRRRLKPLRKCANKSDDGKTSSFIPTNDDDDDDDDESEEDLSKSEEGNLNGFIVDDLDSDYSNDSQDSQDHRSKNSYLQDVFDEGIDYRKIISTIQREKKPKNKWECKGYMLADFGKDAVLCMKAVCVINREQISKEQMYKETSYYHSGRGFNKCDVARGSFLAHFITDGNPQGDIKKTEAELLEFDSKGVEICTTLATRYLRQLLAIFKNKADPFFP